MDFRPWHINAELTGLDETPPSVTITSTVSSLTNISPIPIVITFSENVTDLIIDENIVTNGTKGDLTGSGANYGINITPPITDGEITVNIALM